MIKGVIVIGIFAALIASGVSPAYPAMASHNPYPIPLSGSVQGYRLSGVEPDGDPLYQVALVTKLAGAGGEPAVNLIVDAYLENFKPDTTPVLPDLLHGSKTASNLGGFLQGKVLLTDDAGNVLSLGSFVAEALLNNSNEMALTLFTSGASSSHGQLKGTFTLSRSGSLTGHVGGALHLSAAAKAQIAHNQDAKMKPLKDIISAVTVTPHYYGTNGNNVSGPPLHTGFGNPTAPQQTPPAQAQGQGQTTRQISPWTIVAAIGAVISLALAGFLFWIERRRAAQAKPAA